MTEGSIEIDESRWPFAVHTVMGSPSPATVDAYLVRATEVLARRERHIAILDARGAVGGSAYTRQSGRLWMRTHGDELAKWCAGTVYVVRSPLIRYLVMTSLLVTGLPTPYLVCEDIEEAYVWGKARLDG